MWLSEVGTLLMATLLSVNVGLPRDVNWQGRTVHTGIWKSPVVGPRLVRRLNVEGDGQGDLAGHGGEQRAVLVYQLDSYRHWQTYLGRDDFGYGQFGENFTVDGLPDDEVCIGDRFAIGTAEFEVTQPRVTCFRLGIRLGVPEMAALLVAHHRPGFYLRVLTEGEVRAGDEIVQTFAEPHRLSVADIDALLYLPGRSTDRLRAAAEVRALSPGWRQSFRELLDAAERGREIAEPTVGVEPGWAGFRPLRVQRVEPESPTVTSVYLAERDGKPLIAPRAGQYVTVRVPGAGDPAPVRSYSLSSDPADATYRISVKREEHGIVSRYVNSQVRPGALLDVAAPRGEFVLATAPGPVLLLSAGIGVTPVLAMLYELVAGGAEREVWWVHVARDPVEDAFAEQAHRLVDSLTHGHGQVYYTRQGVSVGSAGEARQGRPTTESLAQLGIPADVTAYVCGPAGFMTDMAEALSRLGVAADRIHTELFGARSAVNPGVIDGQRVRPHQPPGPPGTGAQVSFARSGLTVRWSTDRTLLELAERCDVPTRFSCRTGVCHTCVTSVLSGSVEYSLPPLEPPPDGEVLLCCARPSGDIVLDL
jgi:ferredoxin-NADP reductase/MOSC domain-containing protein YiiM